MEPFEVVKASGEKEEFELSKLRNSLSRAGATNPVIAGVVHSLEEEGLFRDGITTHKIYKEAYRLLREHSDHVAGRYKLKQALFELGPSGYPFEVFVSEIFKHLGYSTKVGRIVEGKCVSHEVDVIAEDDYNVFMIECKFHNRKDHNCSVTTPLYIQSRFLDVRESWKLEEAYQGKQMAGYVVTNTRFTSDARDYATCMNLKLLSWDYPKGAGLKDLIERAAIHPVTSIACLSNREKKLLLKNDIVHCRQVIEEPQLLENIPLNGAKISEILDEAEKMCEKVPGND